MPEQIDIPASFAGVADVTGKRVVITGASRGLGRLLAHAFSQGGARVALVARTETDLKAVADELPGPSLVLSGDVTDEEFNEAVADATVAEWGGVDVWICNAGISPDRGRTARDRSVGLARDPRREPHRRVPRRACRGPGDGRGRAADLHRLGARRAAARGARRVQRVEGRARRPGEGSRARSRARGHHRERRRAGLVRLAVGRAVEEQPRARRRRARAHRATALGRRRPTSPARTSSSPPTRRRSSPAPCSTSTAGTCSYELHARDASSRSPARAERSAPRCRASSRANPTPMSC